MFCRQRIGIVGPRSLFCSGFLGLALVLVGFNWSYARDGNLIFPRGQNEFVIPSHSELPSDLLEVVVATHCISDGSSKERNLTPVYKISTGEWIAVVTCDGGVVQLQQLVFKGQRAKPIATALPMIASGHGFASTTLVGRAEFSLPLMTLTTFLGGDRCPSPKLKHIYEFQKQNTLIAVSPFALREVSYAKDGCKPAAEQNWVVIFKAERWPEGMLPR